MGDGSDEFIEFDVHRFRVFVLGVLNQEHHEKRNDGGAGVDNELPRIAESKQRPRQTPKDDHAKRTSEGGGLPHRVRRGARQTAKA